MSKGDTLADVALQALNRLLQESLLLIGDSLEGIMSFLSTVGLWSNNVISQSSPPTRSLGILTPSSMGTEKKSTPVFLAIASPPGTPGR